MSTISGGCSSPGCDKVVEQRLACPKCIKLGLKPSYYCSQKCFVDSYPVHKSLHSIAKQIQSKKASTTLLDMDDDANTNEDDGITCSLDATPGQKLSLPFWAREDQYYSFTGSLKPCLQSPKKVIPPHIARPDYANHSQGVSESEVRDRGTNKNIRVYKGEELENLRYSCQMGREVLDVAGRAIREGVTTDEIDRVVHEACIERSCYPSPLNYYQFPKSVCTSVNEVICHGIPDYREIKNGDIVNVDVTTFTRGYHGDLNETFLVGNVDDDGVKLVNTAYECLRKASNMIKPGTLYRDLGTVIHKTAAAQKCSVVRTYCGHGIGSLFHTAPNVPHYHKNKAKGIMKPGHVFTIEPMINLGGPGDVTWGDHWTAVTTDGKRSAQFEHTFLVTKDGYEILTARDDEPVMVWNRDLVQR